MRDVRRHLLGRYYQDASGAFVIQPSAEFGGPLLSRLKYSVNHVDVYKRGTDVDICSSP